MVTRSDRDVSTRIGAAWRRIRRRSSARDIKLLFYVEGSDQPLDLVLADALGLLHERGPMHMQDIAHALYTTPASATRTIRCLVDRGYADRSRNNDDSRCVTVSLTEAGTARYLVVQDNSRRGLGRILEEFNPDEQRLLAELLERFARNIARLSITDTSESGGA